MAVQQTSTKRLFCRAIAANIVALRQAALFGSSGRRRRKNGKHSGVAKNMDIFDWSGQRVSLSLNVGTAVLRLFNPPLGYMDEVMEAELLQVLDRLEQWPDGRVVVLTGRDAGMFLRHYDVAVLHQRAQALLAKGKTFSLDRPIGPAGIHRCIERIGNSRLIFIAAINGVAMGGGFELALGCDIRLVQAGDYALGLPELNLGLLPGAGGTQAMARMLGKGQTLFNLLTAKVFSPQQVLAAGLASACVDDVLAHALDLAGGMEAVPARACANIKRLVRNADRWSEAEGQAAERTLFCDCMVDPAAQPLMAAVALGQRTIADPPARFA
jgi:enoyl-CoA hydratase/carnithine racemase